jgi:hypothetical protein
MMNPHSENETILLPNLEGKNKSLKQYKSLKNRFKMSDHI